MRLLRRLYRLFFGDDRYDRLVIYAAKRFSRAVIVDDEYLIRVATGWTEKGTNVKLALGGCPPKAGDSIVLSSSLHGEERIYVLMHEMGHAADFEDFERQVRFNSMWDDKELSLESREFVLDLEETAYELGKKIADEICVDVDEDAWMTYVGRKLHDNIQVYVQPNVV